MGLFCQFVDVSDGGDFGGGLFVELGGAEGAIGLEGAELMEGAVIGALGAGLVATEAFDGGGVGAVAEGIAIAGSGELGFETAEAVEVPSGVEELAESDGFDGALGSELGEERILKGVEFLAFIIADDEVAGGEPVTGCVLPNASLAGDGAGAGGVLGVGLIGDGLCRGCHKVLLWPRK